ncbi:hypothetical protein B0A55_05071 [Friedmanniomyces simplex]|uniref:Uncharacterized protein n=1 Tax=Friedmanniomyces simplex TaxID=329884 RepID=A0A4U0XG15_9PEZI|nr:hypothetical protein B0A55_05071 [Friedmanniomyces simplex]
MPLRDSQTHEKAQAAAGINYETHDLWRKKPLTPAQLLVNDIRLETLRGYGDPMLEVAERSAASLVPQSAAMTPSAAYIRATDAASNAIEKQRFASLEEDYGWMRYLRLPKRQRNVYDSEDSAKCRWVHCSSKFPEYLKGFLWALTEDQATISESMRMLDHAIQGNTRFSKHGKHFAPFFQPLRAGVGAKDGGSIYPLLVSVPFLDWTVLGATPPLRFQVDRREGFQSSKSTAHLLRSVLQYFYRLEDTADRESSQVFAKHKPWTTSRELDLKVRQWYGHYPTALNVDEMWVLAIDAEHVVTLSSNQTWKARWPALQLSSRIEEVSFRGVRNAFFTSEHEQEYTAMTHLIVSLSGAVGMMHRNSWPDMVLPLTDRYAGHLSHLQYRLHRSPSTKLVMDLIACQEELNIVIQITQQQIDMLSGLRSALEIDAEMQDDNKQSVPSPASHRPASATYQGYGGADVWTAPRDRATYRQISASQLSDPMAQVLDNLQRELVDLQDLRDNTDRLITRTIQLVNIRLEDHGKAILVFTVVTIVFLPLNFVSSFFGMNVTDIRNTTRNQSLFWAVAVCVTFGVVASSVFLAFSGGDILEKLMMWRDARRERQVSTTTVLRQTGEARDAGQSFRVFGMERS